MPKPHLAESREAEVRVARNRGAEETLEQPPAGYGVHVMTPSMDAPRDYRMLAVVATKRTTRS
ncbi:hypothetical protein ACWCOW_29185 [Streptomyces sp. NPDC001939]|uniref:hypothetical protein n=1 Tax=unclassified Streptomyces TaxID=2593676 RepID=UPI003320DAF0